MKTVTLKQRAVSWAILTLLVGLTLIAGGITLENWRGEKAWRAFETELRHSGRSLNVSRTADAATTPRDVFQTLLVERLLGPVSATNRAERSYLNRLDALTDAEKEEVDWRALRDKFAGPRIKLIEPPFSSSPAADVLRALEPLNHLRDEMIQASQGRSRVVLLLSPAESVTADWDAVLRLVRVLHVRALAESALGEAEKAAVDIQALQRLAEGLTNDPCSSVGFLIGMRSYRLAASAIGKGCHNHVWSERQLEEFQETFSRFVPRQVAETFVQRQQAQVVAAFDSLLAGQEARGVTLPWWLFRGWGDQNKLAFCRAAERDFAAIFPESTNKLRVIRPDPIKYSSSPYLWLSRHVNPTMHGLLAEYGVAVDHMQLAKVACAIERYYLRHRRLPDHLDHIVPTWLDREPESIFAGYEIVYTAHAENRYRLVSTGSAPDAAIPRQIEM